MHWMDGSKNLTTSVLRSDIVHQGLRYYVKCIPKKFQLAIGNVDFGIIIVATAKQNTLRYIWVHELVLGIFVETFYYAGYIP